MTLAQIATLLFEPRTARYIGRHRAPEVATFVAVASAPRTLSRRDGGARRVRDAGHRLTVSRRPRRPPSSGPSRS